MKLEQLPKWPQRQDSLSAQLADLRVVANRLGFYDAADAIESVRDNAGEAKASQEESLNALEYLVGVARGDGETIARAYRVLKEQLPA